MAYSQNFMKKIGILGLIGTVALTLSCSQPEERDIDKYIAEIRKAGMTESAQKDLSQIASILAGECIIEFPKHETAGVYGTSYRSTLPCSMPGADPEYIKNLRVESQKKTDKMLKKLKPFADYDNSGFISTEEAHDFRYTLKNGYKIRFVLKEENKDVEKAAKGLGLTSAELRKSVEKYNSLAEKLTDLEGKPLPKIDF